MKFDTEDPSGIACCLFSVKWANCFNFLLFHPRGKVLGNLIQTIKLINFLVKVAYETLRLVQVLIPETKVWSKLEN